MLGLFFAFLAILGGSSLGLRPLQIRQCHTLGFIIQNCFPLLTYYFQVLRYVTTLLSHVHCSISTSITILIPIGYHTSDQSNTCLILLFRHSISSVDRIRIQTFTDTSYIYPFSPTIHPLVSTYVVKCYVNEPFHKRD